jgi:hypothetical protein
MALLETLIAIAADHRLARIAKCREPLDTRTNHIRTSHHDRSLRGWANYFRYGVSKATFNAIDSHAWLRLAGSIRRKHHLTSSNQLRRRFCGPGWRIAHDGVVFTGASTRHAQVRDQAKLAA